MRHPPSKSTLRRRGLCATREKSKGSIQGALNGPLAIERQGVMPRPDLLDPNAVGDGLTAAIAADEDSAGPFRSRAESTRNVSEKVVVISRSPRDRAAALAAAIQQIFATTQGWERRQALEAYLRDEISDLLRQAIADRELVDE